MPRDGGRVDRACLTPTDDRCMGMVSNGPKTFPAWPLRRPIGETAAFVHIGR